MILQASPLLFCVMLFALSSASASFGANLIAFLNTRKSSLMATTILTFLMLVFAAYGIYGEVYSTTPTSTIPQ